MRQTVLGALLLVASRAWALDVATCGTVVGASEVARLVVDLDCSTTDRLAVALESNATLGLNGHTLRGAPGSYGIICFGRCTVTGPGEIRGAYMAVYGTSRAITVSDVTLADNLGSVDVALGRLTLRNVTARSTRYGIRARRVDATNVSVSNAGGDCILGKSIRGSGVTVSGCHTGVASQGSVRVVGLVATDNLSVGVHARSTNLVDSTVTGNSFLADPLDILTKRKPRLFGTACGTSGRLERQPDGTYLIGPPWGVCAND